MMTGIGFSVMLKHLKNNYNRRKNPIMATLLLILLTIATGSLAGSIEEKVSTAQDQKSIAITIYNENLTLIKDIRNVMLDKGANRLAWRDISAQIRSETAILRNLTAPGKSQLLEQNFDFDFLTPKKLLEKYIGKEIKVIRMNPATGIETSETATVLTTNEGIILQFDNRIETGTPGRLVFPSMPKDLRDKPTLLISLLNSPQGVHDLELSYLTEGLSWRADYVVALNEINHKLDINSFATLTNQSGMTYQNVKLHLVAGDIHRIQPVHHIHQKMMAFSAETADVAQLKQESLFEYHLYTLPNPTTLAENQTKQVALMSATNIPFNKEYVLEGADYYYSSRQDPINQRDKVNVFINFRNTGEGLGIPLPKGVIRVYKKDLQGESQYIGEDHIDHSVSNASIRLRLGNIFDITADKIQTDFQQLAGTMQHGSIFESAYQITLRNSKKEATVVQVREPLPGDWNIISESLPHTKLKAGLVEWKVPVAANNEAKLIYRVRVKY